MSPDSPKRRLPGTNVAAIVDQQRSAAGRHEPLRQFADKRERRRLEFPDIALFGIFRQRQSCRHRRTGRIVAGGEDQLAVVAESDRPLAPAIRRHDELLDRQGIEKFVGDQEQRAFRQPVQTVDPDRCGVGQGAGLGGAQRFITLDQVEAQGVCKGRDDAADRSQGIGHQHAPSRAGLAQNAGIRPPCLFPDAGQPQADQLAENLADFRCGDEVAATADRCGPPVIAMFGMLERQ